MTNHNSSDCKNQVKQKLYNEHHKDIGDHSTENDKSKSDLTYYISQKHKKIYTSYEKNQMFILDSGASCHVTNQIRYLTNIRRHSTTISIADQNSIECELIGDMFIECESNQIILQNVIYSLLST